MHEIRLSSPTDLDGWRHGARALLAAEIAPHGVVWRLDGDPGNLFDTAPPAPPPEARIAVPRAFLDLADSVIRHNDPARFSLLYRLLWRQAKGERDLLARTTDSDTNRAVTWARQVHREVHHMHAFVRFHETTDEDGPLYLAWFEPEHHIVQLAAPHFAARMASLRWSILTPKATAHWDGRQLSFAEGCARAPELGQDGVAECWKTYYASIFNPARLKVGTMRTHMPSRYWRNMEETAQITDLVKNAGNRTQTMLSAPPTAPSGKALRRMERTLGKHGGTGEPDCPIIENPRKDLAS